ncbi:uncharacterized protein [Panulirus ornatus]|uniref:uncharacterized protein n=1 Tax=Panulirus ornatus TaxID=150431 RepID=UPI003A84B3E3
MKNKENKFKQNKKQWNPKKQKNKQRRPTNRQTKVHIKFDPEDRKEYVKGFHKRKLERRQRAQKKIEEELKKEMKEIRRDRADLVKKMLYQSQETMNIDDDDEEEQEENLKKENVTVTNYGSASVEISGIDLVASQFHIGTNQMQLDVTKNKPTKRKDTDDEDSEDVEVISKEKLDELGIWSQKDLYRSLKKSTFQVMKKSKLMKLKQAKDAKKQKKAQTRINNHRRKLKMKKMRQRHAPPKDKNF